MNRLKHGMKYVVASVLLLAGASWFVFSTSSRTPPKVAEMVTATEGVETPKGSEVADVSQTPKAYEKPEVLRRVEALPQESETFVNALVTQESDEVNEVETVEIAPEAQTQSPVSLGVELGDGQMVASSRYPDVEVLEYRESILPETEKGAGESLLREYLLQPSPEGYVHHLEEVYHPNAAGELELVSTREYVANQVLAIVNNEEGVEAFKARIEAEGFSVTQELMQDEKGNTIVVVKTPELSLDAAPQLQDTITDLQMCSSVDYDDIPSLDAVPNDTSYASLWGMAKIKAPQAWDRRTDASSVIVAVLDTGVNYNHQDLSANMWRNSGEIAGNGRDDDGNGIIDDVYGVLSYNGTRSGDPIDRHGHGSHCAGTIGAVGNNSKGVAGVAWKAKIMALRFANASGSLGSIADAIYCMNYARSNGAKIISCSWGGRGYNSSLSSAINTMRSSGIIVVCAAGNDGTNNDTAPHYPSSYTQNNIVAVAATTSSDRLASFSCYGSTSVDIAAPGYDIYSTLHSSTTAYGSKNGTSMATPHVSGALALIWAHYPSESYTSIINRLYAAGDTVSALSGKVKTGKRLNVGAALTATTTSAPTGVTASRGTYTDRVAVSWNAVTGASYYKVYRATSPTEAKTALSSWQTSRAYNDTTAASGKTYYYYVQAATSSSGANASAYSSYATGYRVANLRDSWDPGDDTASGGTTLTPTTTVHTHGTHKLSGTDSYDFFKISMTAGVTYTFESTGSTDTYAELYSTAADATRLAYNDDGGTDRNFKLTYTPTLTKTYYLRVRAYTIGNNAEYTLKYSCTALKDQWDGDDKDDNVNTGTLLDPTATQQTHGPHTLSSDDEYDFFRISMRAGYTYVFESTGTTDKYGELYQYPASSTSTTLTRVAYDDDSGESLNFRIAYTATVTRMHALRVRAYSVGRDASYSLKYHAIPPEAEIDVIYYRPQSGGQSWGDAVFLNNTATGLTPQYRFTTDDVVYVNYAYCNRFETEIEGEMTNLVMISDNETDDVLWWQTRTVTDLPAGYYGYAGDGAIALEFSAAGSYTLTTILNCDETFHTTVEESEENMLNNTREIVFSVVEPEPTKTLTQITIDGNTSIPSEGTVYYTCTAHYSDNTQARVQPTWTLSTTPNANVYQDGRVAARTITTNETVTLQAAYGEKTATKQITLLAAGNEGATAPFRDVFSYPTAPMTIVCSVKIDGQLAAEGDVVAAFVGEELRGRADVDANGTALLSVYLAQAGEELTFKVWDASAGDEGTVYLASQTLTGEIGAQHGTVTEPFLISANARDAFGLPVVYPNVPMTLCLRVQIDGLDAQAGDMVAAFVGDELRGKESITLVDGKAICLLAVNVNRNSETITFKVWDSHDGKLLTATQTVSAQAGGSVGSPSSPHLITAAQVNNSGTLELNLRTVGWHFVSFNLLPEDTSPTSVFEAINSAIDQVVGCDASDSSTSKVYYPGFPASTLKNLAIGAGYWVKMKSDGSTLTVTGSYDRAKVITLRQGWNQCGYTQENAGTLSQVLATALEDGAIARIVSGVDPETGTTNTYLRGYESSANWQMKPGMGYWVYADRAYSLTYDTPTGTQTAQALSELSARAATATTPLCEYDANGLPILDRSYSGVPCTLTIRPISIYGKSAAIGDYVAFYVGSNTSPCALAEISAESIEDLLISLPAEQGSTIRMKLWNHASGLTHPEIFEAAQSFTVPDPNADLETFAFEVTGTPCTYTVTFELNGLATRTGGGELTQTVAYGADAVLPEIQAIEGYTFSAWDELPVNVRKDMTITALFGEPIDPKPIITYIPTNVDVGVEVEQLVSVVSTTTPKVTVKGLPKGLKFNAKTQTITGVATTPGFYTLTISASNVAVKTPVTKTVQMRVNNIRSEALPGLNYEGIYTLCVPGGTSYTLDIPDGWTVKGLPSGMKWNAKTQSVSGAPTKPGFYTITLTKKTGKVTDTATITVEVLPFPVLTLNTIGDGIGVAKGAGAYLANKKVNLKATATKGSVFAGWYSDALGEHPLALPVDYRTPSASYVMPEAANTTLYAKFVPATADETISITATLTAVQAGEALTIPLSVTSASLPKLSVKGLPKGLKFDAKTLTLSGAVATPGYYTFTVAGTNATVKKATEDTTASFTLQVKNRNELITTPGYDPDMLWTGVKSGDVLSGWVLDESLKGATVKGLPKGLKWDAKTGTLSGSTWAYGKITLTFTSKQKEVTDITLDIAPPDNPIFSELLCKCRDVTGVGFDLVETEPENLAEELETELTLSVKAGVGNTAPTVKVLGVPPGLRASQKKVGDTVYITLAGTPKQAGYYELTVQATDPAKRVIEQVYPLIIAPSYAVGAYCGILEAMSVEGYAPVYLEIERAFGKKAATYLAIYDGTQYKPKCRMSEIVTGYYMTAAYQSGHNMTLVLEMVVEADGSAEMSATDTYSTAIFSYKATPSLKADAAYVEAHDLANLHNLTFISAEEAWQGTLEVKANATVEVKLLSSSGAKATFKGSVTTDGCAYAATTLPASASAQQLLLKANLLDGSVTIWVGAEEPITVTL